MKKIYVANKNVFTFCIILLLFIILQFTFALSWYNDTIKSYQTHIDGIANSLANLLDGEKLQTVLDSGTHNTAYQDISNIFRDFENEFMIDNIYFIYYQGNESKEYFTDSATSERVSPYTLLQKMYSRLFASKFEVDNDFLTSSKAIYNNNELVGYLKVDYYVYGASSSFGSKVVLLMLYTIIISLIFFFLLYKMFTRSDYHRKERTVTYHNMIQTLSKTICQKSKYTSIHSHNVADLSKRIAIHCGVDEKVLNDIEWAGHLHDIGKIGIPDCILNKEGKLTQEEFEHIKQHPEYGREILSETFKDNELFTELEKFRIITDIVSFHHERWDGKGYPYGIKGEQIPFSARIVSIADAIDAMLSERPYRNRMSKEEALEELIRNRGTQFDPMLVDTIIQHSDSIIV